MYIVEGVPYVHGASPPPPPTHLIVLPKTVCRPKLPPKCRFLAPVSVFDQKSKECLKNLKYFLGSGPIFEKSMQKGGQKGGQNTVFWLLAYFTLCYPISPMFPLFPATYWGFPATNFGIKG